jgi:hypothetical protein
MKKRKLNSKNPKYRPVVKKEVTNERKELICETKGVKIYAVFTN